MKISPWRVVYDLTGKRPLADLSKLVMFSKPGALMSAPEVS